MATRRPNQSLPTRPSLHSAPPTSNDGDKLRGPRGFVKTIALVVGGLLTFFLLMATTGLVVESGWIRSIVAALVMLALPAIIVDRLLPETTDARSKGLPTDVFALAWLGIALLYTVGLQGVTRTALLDEGDRLSRAGYERLARLAHFLGGATPKIGAAGGTPKPERAPKPIPVPPPPPAKPLPAASASAAPASSTPASEARAGHPEPNPEPAEQTAGALFAMLAPAVVTVAASGGAEPRSGTGVLVDDQGTLVTNHHVVQGAEQVRVSFPNGAQFEAPELLHQEAAVDLALLRVALDAPDRGERAEVQPPRRADAESVVAGLRVIAIGNPLGLEATLADGVIARVREYDGRSWFETSALITPGNSGGPVFNMKGELIGVSSLALGERFGQGHHVAAPVDVLERMLDGNYPNRRKLGPTDR